MVGETATRELQGQFPNQIIRASAGTGKTFALSNRYLRLLASGAECQTILATTFTKKGAGEILDRIVNRLANAALDEKSASQLSDELQWKLTRPRAASILHELLGNLHRLEISTLDSFFNRVAKAFALELGLNPNWDIVDEQQIDQLQDEAIQTVLRDGNTINLLHMLSKGDAARRVASMVRDTVDNAYEIYRESGPQPWDQVAVTGKFLSDEQLETTIAQMEALELPNKQLPQHWAKVTEFVRQDDWESFIETTSFQRSLDGDFKFGRTKLPPEIIEIYQKLIPHCRAIVEHRLSSQNKSTRELLSAFGAILEQRKNETGYLRFDDITRRLEDFVADTGADHFAFRLDHQIQHLLLDEFQDTSLAQWKIIRPFANNVTQSTDTLRSFFCVGDMKQAIYGWRGGVAEIFDLVDQELANLDPTPPLTTSYRSAQPVIDLVNRVFNNVDQYHCGDEATDKAIHRWTQWFKEHSTQKQDLKGFVTIEMAHDCDQSQKSDATRKDKSRNQNVVTAAVERVRTVLEQTPEHHSIGVIVRTNDQVNDLISRLRQAGIAASEEGGSSLVDSAAVELVLSAIQLADHPGDSIARFHLSHSPLASALGLDPETDTNEPANAQSAQTSAAKLRNQFAKLGYGPTIEWLASHLTAHCTGRELQRLQQLVRVAYESQTDDLRWRLRPSQFVKFVRDEVKIGDQSSARVRVMTIHKCKGLEFDVVVLPIMLSSRGWAGKEPAVVVGRDQPTEPIKIATRYIGKKLQKLMPKQFTSLFEQNRQRNVRESMCVLYVALTRAVHATHVILSHGAKPEHKSESGILLATVCPDAPREQGVIYQAGDEHWYRENKKEDKQDPFDLAKFYSLAVSQNSTRAVSQQIRSGRGLGWAQPSDLEGGNKVQLSDIFARIENQDAVLRGTLLHACFEQINWLDQPMPSKQQLAARLKSIDASVDDTTPFVDSFQTAIERPSIKNILSLSTYSNTLPDHLANLLDSNPNNRLRVHNEFRFAVETNSGLMEGVIDRLVLIHREQQIVAADIIEFKSDEIDAANLTQRVEHHQHQLDAYRDAVCQLTGLGPENVLARLVFISSGDIVATEKNSPTSDDQPDVPTKTNTSPNFHRSHQQTLWSDEG